MVGGRAWTELPRPPAAGAAPAGHVRIGYARASTARQSLSTQTDALAGAGITKVFAEKISTRVKVRPELDKAVALARDIRSSGAAVTIVVHEHKRLGRGIELAALAEQLRADGIGLEFLKGELQGSHDPSGVVFAVLAALAGSEREYIRDRTLEGHEAARARGKSIGGAAVTDDAMLAVARPPPRPGHEPARHRRPARHRHRKEERRAPVASHRDAHAARARRAGRGRAARRRRLPVPARSRPGHRTRQRHRSRADGTSAEPGTPAVSAPPGQRRPSPLPGRDANRCFCAGWSRLALIVR